MLKDIVYKKDPTRPGGGVFIADKKRLDQGDLPRGVFISRDENDKQVRSQSAQEGRRNDADASSNNTNDATTQNSASFEQGSQFYGSLPDSLQGAADGGGGGSLPMDIPYGMGSSSSMHGSVPGGVNYASYSVPATTDGVPYLFSSRILNLPTNAAMGGGGTPHHLHSHIQHPQATNTQQQPHYGLNHSQLYHHHNLNPSLAQPPQPGMMFMSGVPGHQTYQQGLMDQMMVNHLVGNERILDQLPGSMFDWGT
jgi:hypothetical protein